MHEKNGFKVAKKRFTVNYPCIVCLLSPYLLLAGRR